MEELQRSMCAGQSMQSRKDAIAKVQRSAGRLVAFEENYKRDDEDIRSRGGSQNGPPIRQLTAGSVVIDHWSFT